MRSSLFCNLFQIANAHINLTYHPWDLDAGSIFRYVDVFIGRCQDMIEICQAMIDFARFGYDTQRTSNDKCTTTRDTSIFFTLHGG